MHKKAAVAFVFLQADTKIAEARGGEGKPRWSKMCDTDVVANWDDEDDEDDEHDDYDSDGDWDCDDRACGQFKTL